jgi:two-component system, chemotaxis family, response regulator Rcp1
MNGPPQILVVDDNPGDVDLVRESLAETQHQSQVHSVRNLEEAVAFLEHRDRMSSAVIPDLVIMDLNLLHRNGHHLLVKMKASMALRRIPVVVFSSSASNADITRSYELGANCYVSKPADLKRFFAVVRAVEEFWLGYASLPQKENDERSSHARTAH